MVRGYIEYVNILIHRGYVVCCMFSLELWHSSVVSIVVMLHYYWCTRKPLSSSITIYDNYTIAQHHQTNNNPYIYHFNHTLNHQSTNQPHP